MSDEILISNCSPTLAGLKTGNLFGDHFKNSHELAEYVKKYNISLVPKGAKLIPLKFENGRALIYVYRPKKLSHDLKDPLARNILREKGYTSFDPQKLIAQLIRRMNKENSFPHEIGLFLGYPPEDVRGFMKHEKAKLVGTWKVYGDIVNAKKKFDLYKKCVGAYKSAYQTHRSFDRLVVSL